MYHFYGPELARALSESVTETSNKITGEPRAAMNVFSGFESILALPVGARFRRYAMPHVIKTLALVVCVIPFLLGCGTLTARAYRSEFSDDFWPVYPATYCDVGLVSAPFRPMEEVSPGRRVGMCVIGIFDLPISLATDTLLLPYDIYVLASQ